MHLQLLEFLPPHFVVLAQLVNLGLVLAHRCKELRVGLLTRQEELDDLLHIRVTCSRPNVLEGILYLESAFHFPLHLGLHEGTPEPLR